MPILNYFQRIFLSTLAIKNTLMQQNTYIDGQRDFIDGCVIYLELDVIDLKTNNVGKQGVNSLGNTSCKNKKQKNEIS